MENKENEKIIQFLKIEVEKITPDISHFSSIINVTKEKPVRYSIRSTYYNSRIFTKFNLTEIRESVKNGTRTIFITGALGFIAFALVIPNIEKSQAKQADELIATLYDDSNEEIVSLLENSDDINEIDSFETDTETDLNEIYKYEL